VQRIIRESKAEALLEARATKQARGIISKLRACKTRNSPAANPARRHADRSTRPDGRVQPNGQRVKREIAANQIGMKRAASYVGQRAG